MARLRKAFTLIELIIAMIVFVIVIVLVARIFVDMVKTKGGLDGRQTLTKEAYYILEKFQIMSRNYTIDYEEYRNRRNVGCMSPNNATRSGTSNCMMMTYYGNRNILGLSAGLQNTKNILYHCSSINDASLTSLSSQPIIKSQLFSDLSDCSALISAPLGAFTSLSGFIQSYGQYRSMFVDVKDDVDLIPGAYRDDDDYNRGDVLPAIANATGIQELYLISHDGQQRLFFRKKLLDQGDWNKNGIIGDVDSEKLYSIQMLQLKGFDAGDNHNFSITNSSGVYDGQIDTWACDYLVGFICNGASVGGAYPDYKLPLTNDDGWVTLTPTDITLSDRNIIISPTKDSQLTWNDQNAQISPYFQIQFSAKLYGKNWASKIPRSQMDLYSIRLQTIVQVPNLGSKR